MTQPIVAPYGSWKSPITSDLIVSATVGLEQPRPDGGDVYWVEARPAEGGRSVIVRRGFRLRRRTLFAVGASAPS